MRVILIHLSWLFGHLLGRLPAGIAVEEAERAGASAAERTIAAVWALSEGYDRCLMLPDVGGGWRSTVDADHDERSNPWPAPVWAGYEAAATAFEAQGVEDRFGLVMPLPYAADAPPIPCGEAPIPIAGLRPSARDVIATLAQRWALAGINHPGNGDALTIVSGRSSLAQLVDDAAGIDLVRDVAERSGAWTWKRETTGTVHDWIAKIATSPALVPEVTALASLKGIGLETARVLVCGGELRKAKLAGYGSAVAAVEAAVREEKIPGLIAGQLYTLRAAGARKGAGVQRALAVARVWGNVDLDVGALLGARGEERGHGDDEAVQGRAPSAHEDRAAEVRGAVHGERASAEDRGARGREPAAQGARAGGVVGGAGAPAAPGAPAGVRDAERSAPRGDVDVRADAGPVLRVALALAQPRVAASQAEPGAATPGPGAEPAPSPPIAPAARAAPSSEARVTGEGAAEGDVSDEENARAREEIERFSAGLAARPKVATPPVYAAPLTAYERGEPPPCPCICRCFACAGGPHCGRATTGCVPRVPTAAERIHDDGAHVAREETMMSMQSPDDRSTRNPAPPQRSPRQVRAERIRGIFRANARALAALFPKNGMAMVTASVETAVAVSMSMKPEVTAESIAEAAIACHHLGLTVGDAAYIYPHGATAKLTVGPRGLIALAYQSQGIKSIKAVSVFEGDEFSYDLGDDTIHHVKAIEGRRPNGKTPEQCISHVWAKIETAYEGTILEVLTWEDVAYYRSFSKATSRDTPWFQNFEGMCRKTALKRALEFVPRSPMLAAALHESEEGTYALPAELQEMADAILRARSGKPEPEGEAIHEEAQRSREDAA